MDDGQRIDWRAIPRRYRAWQARPLWRKLLWLVSRTVTIVVAYVAAAGAILWYNIPETFEGIAAGDSSILVLIPALATRPELLVLLAILVPAVLAAVLLPHKAAWQR